MAKKIQKPTKKDTKKKSPAVKKKVAPKKSASGGKAGAALLRPFHLAVPVHNLQKAKDFYGKVLGFTEGRSSTKWQDYNFFGNQVVCHWVGEKYRGADYYNPVDGDEVPVAHFGACLMSKEFDTLAARLTKHKVKFIIKPHLRFKGQRGEQKTMFFKDPSNNNLEFKAMSNPDYLFEKAGNY